MTPFASRTSLYSILAAAFLLSCSKKPKPVTPSQPPGPALEKDNGTELADVGRGLDLSAMGFTKAYAPVYFDLNSATPRKDQTATLHFLADDLPKRKACRVEGHACPIGDIAYNEALSYQRAQAVVDYLRAAGVRTGFQVTGYGEERVVAFAWPEYWRNRRVEIACE